jgi:hypothetical protein
MIQLVEVLMGFDKTAFPNFNNFCVDKLGMETGQLVYSKANSILSHLIKEADYRNNKAIKLHMDKNMLPSIAIYLAFKKFEATADKAFEYTDEVLQTARLKAQKNNRFLGRLPFSYLLFKMICRSFMSKQYPEQGWDMEWVRYDKKEIHFNMKSCIYFEITKKYNCTEMCPLFCANDDVVLSGYKPAIIFQRNGTIAKGQEVCDFHFKNGKYIK